MQLHGGASQRLYHADCDAQQRACQGEILWLLGSLCFAGQCTGGVRVLGAPQAILRVQMRFSDRECVYLQVVLLSSPVPGQPLTASSNPSVDDDFVKEMTAILSGADAAHRQSRVERALPYELRAVEVGLATAVRAWEMEAVLLEHKTKPTLRALLQKVRPPQGLCTPASAPWMCARE